MTHFHVQKYRNILDSTVIDVEPDVTCLVGKNEAGKTAALEALYRLNPVYVASFDLQADYPRWRIIADKRTGLTDSAQPIRATFVLEDAEIADVAERFGEKVLTATDVTATRNYGDSGKVVWDLDAAINEGQAVLNVIDKLQISSRVRGALGKLSSLADAHAAAAAARTTLEDQPNPEPAIAELTSFAETAKSLTQGRTVRAVVDEMLTDAMPRFFYFTQYHLLPGRVDLAQLAKVAEQEPAASRERTALSLLSLAGTSPTALATDGYEERKAELEAVSNDLTNQVFEYWRQNPDLRVQFDVDKEIQQVNGAPAVVAHHLDVRVEDRRHQFTNNFDQRSSGFRWFFSFLAAFTEFETTDDSVVVLLDEPGLTLHGKAQADFLRFINERLAPRAQVIYTTHSPFMVETDKIERCRIVEDKGPKEGTVVSRDALLVGDDSLFPLQAALGYDLVQHLFIGDTNLLVEGPSDFVYLDLIGRRLTDLGRAGLDPRWRILPAGGSSNVPAFVTLLGRDLNVTVVVDSGTEGLGRIQTAITAGRLSPKRLIVAGEVTGNSHADIEDLFTVGDYLQLYNAAFGTSVTVDQLQPGPRIIKRIETVRGGKFDHWKPAELLLREPSMVEELDEATLTKFEQLIIRINETIPK